MCIKCLKDAFPERERTTLEAGFYHLNFAGCAECGEKAQSLFQGRDAKPKGGVDEDGAYEETTEYDHTCDKCKHVIAQHHYEFRVSVSGNQEYHMSCSLCGKGEDLGAASSSASNGSTHAHAVTSNVAPTEVSPPSELFAGLKMNAALLPSTSKAKEEDAAAAGEWE